jgi:hypothetical protein
MAIAPLLDIEDPDSSSDPSDMPWPRPVLRVVTESGDDDGEDDDAPAPEAALLRHGPDVAARLSRRRAVRTRRRRLAVTVVLGGLAVGLSLPMSALGAAPVARSHVGGHVTGSVYVVQPGDTLWSIATRFDQGGDPRPLAEALAKETGSTIVTPGEHVVVP